MVQFRSILKVTAEEWMSAMGLASSEIPDIVIVEGSWQRAQRTEWRLGYLEDVRELDLSDIFWGRWREKKIVFCCAYGPARTAEVIHLFGLIGASLAVQIGTCGGLQPHLRSGDILLPEQAACQEGVAQHYGAGQTAAGSIPHIQRVEQILQAQGHTVHRGPHLTWPALFMETEALMQSWHQAGFLGVDMETATTFAVANYFNMPAISLLVVWDALTSGKSFIDPLEAGEQAALDAANAAVFEAALALAEAIPA